MEQPRLNPYALDPATNQSQRPGSNQGDESAGKNFSENEHQLMIAIRDKHALVELGMRRIGLVYFALSVIVCLLSLYYARELYLNSVEIEFLNQSSESISMKILMLLGLVLTLVIGIAMCQVSLKLMQLNESYATAGLLVSIIWLGTGIGTIPALIYLYLITSTKGQYVFSSDYKRVIAGTRGYR